MTGIRLSIVVAPGRVCVKRSFHELLKIVRSTGIAGDSLSVSDFAKLWTHMPTPVRLLRAGR